MSNRRWSFLCRAVRATFLLGLLSACTHGIDIQGEGAVTSSSGERDCSSSEAPCTFKVANEYLETYTAVPAQGYEFSAWINCTNLGALIVNQGATCSYSIPAASVHPNWGKVMPNLQAVFTPSTQFGLTARAPLADIVLPIAGTALTEYVLEDKFPSLRFPGALFLSANPVDGRLVVVEQGGIIHAFDNSPDTTTTAVIVDLSERVISTSEQGIIGLAFDPDFSETRWVYLHYSLAEPLRSVIARFTWDADSDELLLASEKVLLEIPQPAGNHNGGMLEFGPDGYLYISLGDGGGAGDPFNNGQDKSTLLSSLLRINVHPVDTEEAYTIPLDNPFIDEPNSRGEIFAYGLRNPFRFSFDRQTGKLWLADVGQGRREEVNLITAGGNYGWKIMEGNTIYDQDLADTSTAELLPPLFEYSHEVGFSITGGYVYRGSELPSLIGRYIYADYVTGAVSALSIDGDQPTSETLATARRPTSFGEDRNGELYVVTRTQGIYGLLESTSTGAAIPEKLSETGLFTNLENLEAASGLIEYDLNHPFYSDGSYKRRWFAIPDDSTIQFDADKPWILPSNSIVVKHFEMELREGEVDTRKRLETRLLLNTQQGWQGFSYRWDADGNDATLINSRQTEQLEITGRGGAVRQQRYDYPSRTDCLACHTEVAGNTLGLNTAQMNKTFNYPTTADNQLRSFNNIGLFDIDIFDDGIGNAQAYNRLPSINEGGFTLAQRARAYLDVNCAQCHQPEGGTPVSIDLRNTVDLQAMNLLGIDPVAGDLGIQGAKIVAAGAKENSVLWWRMRRLDNQRMPPISSHKIDSKGMNLVGSWIDSL